MNLEECKIMQNLLKKDIERLPGFLNVQRYHENVKSLAHKKTIIMGKLIK